jgi:hypothetical protein
MDSITLIVVLALILLLLICVVVFLTRRFNKSQLLLFGFLLIPILDGLYGGYIPYPVHPGKIYFLYVAMAVLLTVSRTRLQAFLGGSGLTLTCCFAVLLILNSFSYFFVNGSLVLNLSSTFYLSSLLLIAFYSYCARVSGEDLDRVLPIYFLVVLLPIFVVCILEVSGQRQLSLFFAGPRYVDISTERLGILRLNGIFHWSNNLANYLSCLFVLYMWRAHRSRIFYLAGVVIFIFICLTFTRANIVACMFVGVLCLKNQGRRFQTYMWVGFIAVLSMLLWQQGKKTIAEVNDQYIHNLSPRSYYVLKGIDIASRNFPLGEGAYSTGPYIGKLAQQNFKKKYNLSDEGLRTTDSFLAALLIEFGFLGSGLLFLMVLWLWKNDRNGLLRYMVILLGITAYSNADILSPMRAENILFFLAAGISLSVRESYSLDDIGVPDEGQFKASRLRSTRFIA